jgi:hypothetical protein
MGKTVGRTVTVCIGISWNPRILILTFTPILVYAREELMISTTATFT